MPDDTNAGDDADAVTYAGPDDSTMGPVSVTETESAESTNATTNATTTGTDTTDTTVGTTYDPTDADAVTYAGPDEDTSVGWDDTSSESDSSGTDSTTTDTSGDGSSTDPNG